MAIFDLPPSWDARKFATRYGLDFRKDFYINGDGKLVVGPRLPDNPPIFELSDPPGPTKEQLLEQRLVTIEARLTAVEAKPI